MTETHDSNQSAHYVHRLSYSARERLVGFFVLLAGLFLLALIGVNEKTLRYFETKVDFHAHFSDAKGLSTDTLVKVLGLEVGKVASLEISDDHRIHATLRIRERYRHFVRAGSRARLNRLGAIGGATIEITAGAMEEPELAAGAELPAEESRSLDELLEGLAGFAELASTESNLTLLAELRTTVSNLKEITGAIRSGSGTVGTLVYDGEFQDDLVNTVALLEEVMNTASSSVSELPELVTGTQRIVTDVRTSTGKLPAMVTRADHAIVKVNSALDILGNELDQFPDLLVRLNLMLEEANRVLEAMQRVWPLSSAVRQREDALEIGAQPVNE